MFNPPGKAELWSFFNRADFHGGHTVMFKNLSTMTRRPFPRVRAWKVPRHQLRFDSSIFYLILLIHLLKDSFRIKVVNFIEYLAITTTTTYYYS